MLTFAYYILKVIICSAVLYGYYWFFLRNKVFHSYNRFYLLTITLLSLILPLLKFNVWQKADAPKIAVVQMLQVVNSSDEFMDEIIIQSHYNHISKEEIIMWIFIAISITLTVLFINTIFKIFSLKKNNPTEELAGISLIRTEDKKTPFSFLKNIFWNNEIDINSTNGKRILKHEVAHVQEKHTHDKLFINIVLIFFWSNPIFWLIRKELNMIHEFIADKKAVEGGDTAAFAAMILQSTYPSHRFELTNNFFYSPIKRRLSMLTKNKTKVSYISRLLVLPLLVIVFAAFTLKAKTYITSLPNNDKTITVVIDAGHGGNDNGAVAPDGTTEKELTLSIAKKIQELNKSTNLKILLTRDADIYQDPKTKAGLANKFGADLFISIHVNNAPAAGDEKQTGMEVFVARDEFKNTGKSKLFAASITAAFHNNYLLSVPENPSQSKRGITVLEQTSCPSVLIEAGFVSNKKDLAYLQSTDGKEQFARNVLNAIFSYINTTAVIESDKPSQLQVSSKNKNTAASQDTVPDFKPLLNKIASDRFIDASQSLALTSIKYENFYVLTKLSSNTANPQPLIIIDGTESTVKQLNEIAKDDFQYIRILKPETAIPVYGEKAEQGALIVNTKTIPASHVKLQETEKGNAVYIDDRSYQLFDKNEYIATNQKLPVINLSGISAPFINVNKLPELKELKCSDDNYKIKSATVYFSGNGFRDVIMSNLNDGSLKSLESFMSKIISGSVLTFDNVYISKKDGSGKTEIRGRSFRFYDKDINEVDPDTLPNKVFMKVDQEAEFPGGKDAWQDYLRKNLNAGTPVDEGWKPGTYKVVVNFVVDRQGNVSAVSSDDFINSKTAQQCINLIKNGPKWIPAKQNGKTVNSYRKQPITFVVSES